MLIRVSTLLDLCERLIEPLKMALVIEDAAKSASMPNLNNRYAPVGNPEVAKASHVPAEQRAYCDFDRASMRYNEYALASMS